MRRQELRFLEVILGHAGLVAFQRDLAQPVIGHVVTGILLDHFGEDGLGLLGVAFFLVDAGQAGHHLGALLAQVHRALQGPLGALDVLDLDQGVAVIGPHVLVPALDGRHLGVQGGRVRVLAVVEADVGQGSGGLHVG
jgi:hypothetical protein